MIFLLAEVTTESSAQAVFGKAVLLGELKALSDRLPTGAELMFEVRECGVVRDFPSGRPIGNILARIGALPRNDIGPRAAVEIPDVNDIPRVGVGYGYTPTEAFENAMADYASKAADG